MKNKPRSVLLVEDDESIREVTELSLTMAGYEVLCCSDGEAALAELKRNVPDLVLSDVVMPRVDGFDLLRTVRRSAVWHTLPFVVMSARADSADLRMGMSLGADDYVTKPFKTEDLLQTLRLRLERADFLDEITRGKQRFLSRVLPHELRTPLTGIIGYADLLVQVAEAGEVLSAPELADYGRNIGRSGQRLLRLAEDFSLWAEYEIAADQRRKQEDPGWAESVITEDGLARHFRQVAEDYGRGSDLDLKLTCGSLAVPGPGLERVLRHLVENAFYYSKPGESVLVEAGANQKQFRFLVVDRGRGMTPEQIKRIGPMRQFGREIHEQQGMGLGLALASRLAELAGGEFNLEPNQGAPGTKAELVLPRWTNPAERSRSIGEVIPGGSG